MDVALDNYRRLPPMSRSIATLAFVISVGIVLGMLDHKSFIFHEFFIFRFPPQIWRFATSFLITGSGIGLLFDTYFLYSYLSQMEVGNPRFSRKEDLIWYLTFVCGTILVANYFTNFGFMSFLPALILALSYTVTQDQRGAKVSYMFITMPAQLMPYAMLAINLLFPGGVFNMILQVHGLFAGHLFDFLSRTWPEYGGGSNLIPTPAILSRLVQSTESLLQRGFSGPARPAGRTLGGDAGASSGPLPDAWRTRGPGQRLG